MFSFEEIDENIVAIALYKIRDVKGVEKAERIILPPPPSMFPSMGFDPMANQGIVLEINGKRCFLPYIEAKDMCHNTLGPMIAENFVRRNLDELV
ncbi:MAG TPA: hypothetical protein PK122_04125 [Candidatus Paceibacterota bacterium]|jgi:hypothetical protein|nr:hypothetical protein [Candidatus Paceibacterota bacterium]